MRMRGPRLYCPRRVRRFVDEAGEDMDVIEGILKAAALILFLLLVVGALAALTMIVLGIATGIDDKLQS